jgi:hypothetical protein
MQNHPQHDRNDQDAFYDLRDKSIGLLSIEAAADGSPTFVAFQIVSAVNDAGVHG